MRLSAGKYWVGDLCYVLADKKGVNFSWEKFCDFCFDNDPTGRLNEGVVEHQNLRFAYHGTAYGDGRYEDQMGNDYPVDAGMIGCVPYAFIEGKIDEKELIRLGTIHIFDESFDSSYNDGLIRFGHVEIETEGSDEEYEEYGEECEEDVEKD